MEETVSEVCSSKEKREDIWMDDAMRREIGELMGKANATSRSDFVRQAVKEMVVFLFLKKI